LRVLFLRRQSIGGIATASEVLARELEKLEIEVVIDDAADWIPNQTGFTVDRRVSKLVKKAAQGFDLVHAWGYRAAWAASEAFYLRFPWVFTAYDIPKTTNSQLIDRLNAARTGFCSSRAVKLALEAADTINLETILPGIPETPAIADRTDARQRLALPSQGQIVLGFGRMVPERGFDALLKAMSTVWSHHGDAHLVLLGDGPEHRRIEERARGEGARVSVVSRVVDKWIWYAAADLVVVPSRRAGFSMVAAEAMAAGRAVLTRRTGGLPEMGSEDVTIAHFYDDEDLGDRISALLEQPELLNTMGYAGQVRMEDRYDCREAARRHSTVYRDLLAM